MKWRRRTYEVEAILFTGDNAQEIKSFLGDPWKVDLVDLDKPKDGRYFIWCVKKDGSMDITFLPKNKFVVKCLEEFFVMDKEKFLSEYEKVSV